MVGVAVVTAVALVLATESLPQVTAPRPQSASYIYKMVTCHWPFKGHCNKAMIYCTTNEMPEQSMLVPLRSAVDVLRHPLVEYHAIKNLEAHLDLVDCYLKTAKCVV